MSYSHPLTRAEAIARHLREEIVTGRLAPGTVIKDGELAERLGVSITPVREAIVLLSAEGLIDISPNRIRRVTDVSQKNALELIDVMCVLACAGVEWGVPNLTGADLTRMRQHLNLPPKVIGALLALALHALALQARDLAALRVLRHRERHRTFEGRHAHFGTTKRFAHRDRQ